MASSYSMQKQPWYLKRGWIYAMCFITPPIGLINVFVHRKGWQRDEKIEYAGIAIITGSFWLLKFFPFWMSMAFAVFGLLCLYGLDLIDLLRK